jgi:uncharacterized membrane protein
MALKPFRFCHKNLHTIAIGQSDFVTLKDILEERETDRLEAFSDGVFAFAITLLVLGLYDPATRGSPLLQGLLNEWPTFFASVTSFMTILIMWINHHNMFNYVRRVSRELMLLNGLLLLFVVITPFTTLLVSDHLLSNDANTAAFVYSGTFFLIGIVWNILWHNASHHHKLIDERVPKSQIQRIARQYSIAPLLYGISFFAAFFNAFASVILIILVAVYYGITVTGGEIVSD